MADETTARFGLPLLAAGQAQKEVTHNEALALLDLAVQPLVQAVGLDVPPASPLAGQAWIVGAAPQGGWIGHAQAIAGWTAGGWRFVHPAEGMAARRTDGLVALYRGGAWSVGDVAAGRVVVAGLPVVGARAGAIGTPAGGGVIDSEARTAVAAILVALRGHGLIAP